MQNAWFTRRSARRTAARLDPVARLLCRRYAELKSTPTPRAADGPVDVAYYTRICRFHLIAHALVEEGVLIRDPERGWFEFPSKREGRPIRLAWRLERPQETGS